MTKPLPSQEELRRIFVYYEGGYFRWRIKPSDNIEIGDLVGSVREDGYVQVMYQYENYLLHRLIYMWEHGHCPDVVDHIDGDPSNNRISNLRGLSHANNILMSRKTSAKSKFRGVIKTPSGRYRAASTRNNKTVYLGTFDTAEEASSAYEEYRQRRLNNE